MDIKKYLNRDFLVKAGIIAGIVILVVVAIILIVSTANASEFANGVNKGENKKLYGEEGDVIAAYPDYKNEVEAPITTATLKGFIGDKVILTLNNVTVSLLPGETVGDIMVKSFDADACKVILSFPGSATADQELSFSAPSCSFER